MGFFKDLFNTVTLGLFQDLPEPPKPRRPAPAPKREQRVGEDDISVGEADTTRGSKPVAGSRSTRKGNFLSVLNTAQENEIGLGL